MSCTTLPSLSPRSTGPRIAWPALGAAGGFLLLGLVLRLVHYLWNHTIWYDEAGLLFNILDKDYLRLLGPLDYEVAAPPLFLWGLRALLGVFGDHAYVWRFPFFLLSCLTLVLTMVLARRVLRPAPAAFFVGLVALSDAFVWLGCNVKPYILDAFLATGILYVWVRTEEWTPVRRMLLFAAAAPLLLCASYPMLFLYAGIFLAFLSIVGRERRFASWVAYLVLVAIVLATFACLYFGPIHVQRVSGLVAGWRNKFPDLSRPTTVPGWIVGNAFLVFHYCFNPVGGVCVLFVAAGAWWCLANRRFDWFCLCLGPVGACLLAAILQIYPFSGNRLILFTAPGIGLMTALGVSVSLDMWQSRSRWLLAWLVALLILPEAGLCVLRIHAPWDYPDAAGTVRYVNEQRQPGEFVASDDMSYTYAFYGELRSLDETAHTPYRDGQRVWVLMEHYTPERRREAILTRLVPAGWQLHSEKVFHRTSVLLLVRNPKSATAARAE